MRHDLGAVVPGRSSADVVVLLHGFLATAGVLRPLRVELERGAGAGIASFTHAPGTSVTELAVKLREVVRTLFGAERLHLVGHSIGGLAVRWFVQELGSDPRVAQTISIASPFEGAARARFLPGRLGREIAPGSEFLARLRVGLARPGGVPHLSIAGSHDRVVASGALPEGGEHLLVEGSGHNAVLYHPAVLAAVSARVSALSRAGL